MRLKLPFFGTRHADETDKAIAIRERDAREARQLARLARSEAMDNLFGNMLTHPPQQDATK